jgi:hypothetical protein
VKQESNGPKSAESFDRIGERYDEFFIERAVTNRLRTASTPETTVLLVLKDYALPCPPPPGTDASRAADARFGSAM